MTPWLKDNASLILWWGALIAASLIMFSASRGTRFQQFGKALLTASVSLLIAIGLFEIIWQLLMRWIASTGPQDREARLR
jgi:hypothetical protein